MTPKLCPNCSTPIPAAAPGGFCPACLLRDAADQPPSGRAAPSVEVVAAAFPALEIMSLIGQGGMGSVYKVRQPSLDRIVALKILAPELSTDPAFAERFAREARVLGKLNHPNIVTVYEHGQCGGFYYLIMEYVDGVNLRQAMRAGRFAPEQALAIVPGICDALQAAHAQGIWHRDIKPENILLDQHGVVKIVDFGIARLVGDPERNFTLTATGNALGSAAYMAPEQHESPHTVDHRADIYSLGVVIYEMLTGELPLGRFPAPSQRAAVSARIDEIVFQTLEKERELRQQSAAEVKTDVQSVREINGDPLPMPPPTHGWTARSTAKAAMLGGLVLFISARIFTREPTESLLLALSAVPIVLGFLGWRFLPKPLLTVEGALREMNRLANEYLTEKFGELLAPGSPLAAPDSFQFGRQLLEGTLIHIHRGQTRPSDFMNRPQVSLVADLLRSNGDRESVKCLFRKEPDGWRLLEYEEIDQITKPDVQTASSSNVRQTSTAKPSRGGKNALWWFGGAVMVLLVAVVTNSLFRSTTAPARVLGRIKCAVLKTETSGHGLASFIFDVAAGKSPYWLPDSGQSVQMKDGKTFWFKAGVNTQSVPPVASVAVSSDGKTWETHPQTMELRNDLDARTLVFSNGLQIGLSWSPEGRVGMMSSGPVATSPTPFLEWAQGEWVMDRHETMKARTSLGISSVEPQEKLLHLRFNTAQFEMWNTKDGPPEATKAPYGLHRCALPMTREDDPAGSLVVTLKPGDSGAKIGFSKVPDGRLRGDISEGQEQYLVVFKRSEKSESTAQENKPTSLPPPKASVEDAMFELNRLANGSDKNGFLALLGDGASVREPTEFSKAMDRLKGKLVFTKQGNLGIADPLKRAHCTLAAEFEEDSGLIHCAETQFRLDDGHWQMIRCSGPDNEVKCRFEFHPPEPGNAQEILRKYGKGPFAMSSWKAVKGEDSLFEYKMQGESQDHILEEINRRIADLKVKLERDGLAKYFKMINPPTRPEKPLWVR